MFVLIFDPCRKAIGRAPAGAGRAAWVPRGRVDGARQRPSPGGAKLGLSAGSSCWDQAGHGFARGDLLTSTGRFTGKRPWLHGGRVFTLPSFLPNEEMVISNEPQLHPRGRAIAERSSRSLSAFAVENPPPSSAGGSFSLLITLEASPRVLLGTADVPSQIHPHFP